MNPGLIDITLPLFLISERLTTSLTKRDTDESTAADNTAAEADTATQVFSPERALEAVGERWSLAIFREAMFRATTRFVDFEKKLGVAPDILAARLDGFVGAGLMEVSALSGDPAGRQYSLTEKGLNLEPVIVALITWGDGWSATQVGQDPPRPEFDHPQSITPSGSERDPDSPAVATIEISVLGSFSVKAGGKAISPMSIGSQRLLIFLALHDRAVARNAMAGTIWPTASEERAGISLRSALSRLDHATHEAILVATAGLRLADTVVVDFRYAQALARRLLQPVPHVNDEDLSAAAISVLSAELLPDWYDDWIVAEAEDWRQLRMNALEAQARLLTSAGRLAEAAGAARAAIKVARTGNGQGR